MLIDEACSGHGTCMTMREAAQNTDFVQLFREVDYDNWDADMIQGCVCNEGWSGFDCSERTCPWGVDPRDTSGKDEVQLLDCQCPGTCSGYFTLGYKGKNTARIPHDATALLVEAELEKLSTVADVRVTTHGAGTVCPSHGAATAITFLRDYSRHPNMLNVTVNATKLASSAGSVTANMKYQGQSSAITGQGSIKSVKGTKEPMECSGRGTCNSDNGKCTCYEGYGPASDGRGGLPTVDNNYLDCGSIREDFNWTGITCPSVSPQWGGSYSMCSGKQTPGAGGCVNYNCNCSHGYEGAACEWLTCPWGKSWFDEATGTNTAHAKAACSNAGRCNRKSGACTCTPADVFEGAACSLMACAKNDSYVCGDKGVCMTMNKLATYSTTNGEYNDASYTYSNSAWDANKIQGCYCRKSMSANAYDWDSQQIDLTEVAFHTYRGFYARTHTDYVGYDCSKMECPRGDDPATLGENEVQRITCSASSGGFYLKFRENTTAFINYNDKLNTFKKKLKDLISVGDISVTYTNSTDAGTAGHGDAKGICNTTYVDVEFKTELGDLPLMKIVGSTLVGKLSGGSSSIQKINVTEHVKGTKENLECNGYGYCNRDIGMCTCIEGYKSSDGNGNVGHRGDCGFKHEDTTKYLPEDSTE